MIEHSIIRTLLQEQYNVSVTAIEKLDSYADQNFKISSENKCYLLKGTSSDSLAFIQCQNQLLQHLKDFKVRTSEVYRSTKDLYHVQLNISGEDYTFRLFNFLEGEFLATRDFSFDLIGSFGAYMGALDRVCFSYKGSEFFESSSIWNLKNTSLCRELLGSITSAEDRRIVHAFVRDFENTVLSIIRDLPQQIIHNDANPWNVLVDGDRVTGIIDFGDMAYGPKVFDIAIALCYILLRDDSDLSLCSAFLKEYSKELSITPKEISLLYYCIAARLATSFTKSSLKIQNQPENKYASGDHVAVRETLHRWIAINPQAVENTFCEAAGVAKPLVKNSHELLKVRKENFSQSMSISYTDPIHMYKASMQYMYSTDGRVYLDCVNNICHVGHCHPRISDVINQQASRLNTNTRYLYDSMSEYSELLLSKFPARLNKVFFVNSGSAATDLAYRILRAHNKDGDIAVMSGGYHGNTDRSIEISSYKFDGKGGQGAGQQIKVLDSPDLFRGKYTDADAVSKYLSDASTKLDGNSVAGFFHESILSCGGQIVLPDGYVSGMYDIVRGKGGLCIADEVQVGFGRVGDKFWGFELYDVIPDMVILGKPMGNGHPMGAVVCTEEVCRSFENGMEFFSSFGGNPVSCAIGAEVLNIIHDEDLQGHAKELGAYIMEQWKGLQKEFEFVGDVRGSGLFLGIELVNNKEDRRPNETLATQIVSSLKNKGILLSTDGPDHNVIKFKPPMVFNRNDADRLYVLIKEECGLIVQSNNA